jgi:hypothetical protein
LRVSSCSGSARSTSLEQSIILPALPALGDHYHASLIAVAGS